MNLFTEMSVDEILLWQKQVNDDGSIGLLGVELIESQQALIELGAINDLYEFLPLPSVAS